MWAMVLRAQAPACAWCAATEAFPGVRVQIVAHVPTDGRLVVEEVGVSGLGWRDMVEKLKTLPSVKKTTIIESTPERARLRVLLESCPLSRAISASGALPRFPFEIKAGSEEWLLISERDEGAAFVGELRRQDVPVQVVSSREYRRHNSLTARQRELIEAAIGQGYYEVPRRVTLTKLAERLCVAKSTLSETLARGERRLLEDLQH